MVKTFQFSDVFTSEKNSNNIHVTGMLNLKTPFQKLQGLDTRLSNIRATAT